MRGHRCLKSIYQTVFNPQLETPITPEQKALFEQGSIVGEEARRRFAQGVLVDNAPWDFIGSLRRTRELLAEGTEVLFEAAFEYRGCYARVDILQFSRETQRWKVFEVKSSTKVKDEQIEDVGLQAWIIANSGLPIEQINILHINTECRYPHLENLFVADDVTEKIRVIYKGIQPKVKGIFEVLRQEEVPDIDIGPYCETPNDCGFKEACWREKNIPSVSIFNLPQINSRKWDLYQKGVIYLDDPRLQGLEANQQRMVNSYKSGQRYVDSEGIAKALSLWKFPLVFLDFETINPAIPRYDGCRPFAHVPFQWSVHRWPSMEAELSHSEFLHTSKSDPRPTLIAELIKACDGEGSVVSYYGKFEIDRMRELADFSPVHREALEAIIARVVDPLPILREFVYDNAFKGSFSLKSVAPALLGEQHSYEGLLVKDGGAAQRAFEEMISDTVSVERASELRRGLLEYCKQDTFVMLELVRWLYQASALR